MSDGTPARRTYGPPDGTSPYGPNAERWAAESPKPTLAGGGAPTSRGNRSGLALLACAASRSRAASSTRWSNPRTRSSG